MPPAVGKSPLARPSGHARPRRRPAGHDGHARGRLRAHVSGLGALSDDTGDGADAVRSLSSEPAAFDAWCVRWRARISEVGRSPDEIRRDMD